MEDQVTVAVPDDQSLVHLTEEDNNAALHPASFAVQTSRTSPLPSDNGTSSTQSTRQLARPNLTLPQVQLVEQRHQAADDQRDSVRSANGTNLTRAKLLTRHRQKRRDASALVGASSGASAKKVKAFSNNMVKGTVDDVSQGPGRAGIAHWISSARSHQETWFQIKIVVSSLLCLICVVGCCLIRVERSTGDDDEGEEKMGEDDRVLSSEHGELDSVAEDEKAAKGLSAILSADVAAGVPTIVLDGARVQGSANEPGTSGAAGTGEPQEAKQDGEMSAKHS
jgi:hypothetical protein